MGAKLSKSRVRFLPPQEPHNTVRSHNYTPLVSQANDTWTEQTIADVTGPSEQTLRKCVGQDGEEDEGSLDPLSTYSLKTETDIISVNEEEPALVVQPGGHFVNAKTMKHKDFRGHQVRARHIHSTNPAMGEWSTQKLISQWQTPNLQDEIKKCILSQKIHKLKTQSKMAEMSKFLLLDDEHIRKVVLTCLRQFVYASEDNVNVEEITAVEENIWKSLSQYQDHVFDLGILNLMLFSCLLCNPDRSEETVEKLTEISATRKESIEDLIKEKRCTAAHDLLKAMLHYHQVFPKRLVRKSGLVFGSEVKNASYINKQESLTLVKKAHFCDTFTHLFSLLKQTMVPGCEKTLAYMKFVYCALLGGQCPRGIQAMRMLLVTGCIHSLTSAFNKGDVQIGDVKETCKTDLTEFITRTVEELRTSSLPSLLSCFRVSNNRVCRENRLQCLLQETLPLLWHPGLSVREQIHDLQEHIDELLLQKVVQQEIERGQAYAGLHIDYEVSENRSQFRTYNGRMGTQKVLIHAHKPDFDHFYCPTFYEHINQDMRDNMHNFDMLRKLKSHDNLVELYAYNVTSVPIYYIVEDCLEMTLQHHVLQRRTSIDWLTDLELCDFLMEITSGLMALHRQKVLLRDLTLNNMFLVRNRVKIGDLSVACSFQSDQCPEVRDFYPGAIPTRWTCHEAWLTGSFTPQSDIWALGLVIYTLWTHGCDPFTEYYKDSTEEIMRMVMFENILPFQWLCIPDEMYTLLTRCMRKVTAERIELSLFRDTLQTYMDQLKPDPTYSETVDTSFDVIVKKHMFYPVLCPRQIMRNHVPEKGVPGYIHEFRKVKERGYVNMRSDAWIASRIPAVTQTELMASDDIRLNLNPEGGITVEEIMTEEFVKHTVPDLTAAGFRQIRVDCHTKTEPHGPGFYIQHRLYPDCDTLDDVAGSHGLDANFLIGCSGFIEKYIHLCLQVAEALKDFHEKKWLHRDLRAKNFLVNKSTCEVYVSRVCRMKKLSQISDIAFSIPSKESTRWLPPETLIDNIYSAPGDVYMWAMMTFEVLQSYDLHSTNPSRTKVLRVPYCMLKDKELIMAKQNGDSPTKPDICPEWLYNLLQKCWRPDRTQRPTIADVVQVLRENLRDAITCHQRRMELKQDMAPFLRAGDPPNVCQRSRVSPLKRLGKFRRTVKGIINRLRNNPEEDNTYDDCEHPLYSQGNIYESLKVPQATTSEHNDHLSTDVVRLRSHRGRNKTRRRTQRWMILSPFTSASSSTPSNTTRRLKKRRKRRSSSTQVKSLFHVEPEGRDNLAFNDTGDESVSGTNEHLRQEDSLELGEPRILSSSVQRREETLRLSLNIVNGDTGDNHPPKPNGATHSITGVSPRPRMNENTGIVNLKRSTVYHNWTFQPAPMSPDYLRVEEEDDGYLRAIVDAQCTTFNEDDV
ncbi:uncharacterized protein [Haliotis cracherodii]|uniref:uncharacterized protein isoform X1 n=2 Tax=Haliotis cracherodii TaxID=6455 RepID=UPI0039ED86E4